MIGHPLNLDVVAIAHNHHFCIVAAVGVYRENIAIYKLIGGVVIAVNRRRAVAFALQSGEVERVKIHAAEINDGRAALRFHLALCRAYLVPEDIAIAANLRAGIEVKLECSLNGAGAI